MAELTSAERVARVLRRKEPDRIPHFEWIIDRRVREAVLPGCTMEEFTVRMGLDAILTALEVFPPDNPWNLVVEDWPLHPNSKNIIASIGPEKPFRYNPDMGFILVPPQQKRVDVKIVGYPGESDAGPYPVPDNVPIEGAHLGMLAGLDNLCRAPFGRLYYHLLVWRYWRRRRSRPRTDHSQCRGATYLPQGGSDGSPPFAYPSSQSCFNGGH